MPEPTREGRTAPRGGTRAAPAAARAEGGRIEAALMAGCSRCPACGGEGIPPGPRLCDGCGASRYLAPSGGSPPGPELA